MNIINKSETVSQIESAASHRTGLAAFTLPKTVSKKSVRKLALLTNCNQSGNQWEAASIDQHTMKLQEILSEMEQQNILHSKTKKDLLDMIELDITRAHLAKEREELARTKQDLDRTRQELEQFMRSASHDLQEPLRMVSSYTRLLSSKYKGRLDNEADEFISFAADGADRMQSLLNNMLKYSRIHTDRNDLKIINSGEILDEALANLQLVIQENSAAITLGPLPTVLVDPLQLSRVFQNLIINAIHYRKGEAPAIRISAERTGDEWIFSVRDNGKGIVPEERKSIFTLYHRSAKNSNISGSGIGLAICKKIVEGHGGRIWVTSNTSGGSTFNFSIPTGVKSNDY
ncbi:MAG: PAS domain-containing sensor histidine kinase [Nitrospira sp.]|nr:PAS domain-containing sensor histidine kinase [bacterium]MBL7050134.1 PAS domain-containing sensor histidine kinase [Nitrospira sp.]